MLVQAMTVVKTLTGVRPTRAALSRPVQTYPPELKAPVMFPSPVATVHLAMSKTRTTRPGRQHEHKYPNFLRPVSNNFSLLHTFQTLSLNMETK